ncbi:MAG: protein TolQ [Alphaproteobacteria bacterium]|nr:protein TolQ [Alphaproteobacteria bacterium]MBL6936630.1 protein TolQ [Alphaproteobacteria bacterium]MBL7097399.1 protein TolQ [Alphaproteobacteria bacterium]
MKLLRAFAFAALTVVLASPALAQRAPSAAPTNSGVTETNDLAPPSAAPTTAVDTVPAGDNNSLDNSGLGRLSIVSVFWRADPIVKAVMVILLAASLWSWTIIFNKWLAFGTLKRRAAKFEKTFWSGQSLDELYQQFAGKADHPMAATFVAALREWRRAFEGGAPRESFLPSIKDRIDKAMSVTILRETDGLERQLGFLATVGSTAPFVGLFGTVWGIMNSFTAIAAQHNTTLAVVAPGIAEALFATAMGLLAAIPAVIFYNRFVNEIGRYTTRLDAFAEEFSAILSRQLDEKAR